MGFCTECGASLSGAKFCGKCGRKVDDTESKAATPAAGADVSSFSIANLRDKLILGTFQFRGKMVDLVKVSVGTGWELTTLLKDGGKEFVSVSVEPKGVKDLKLASNEFVVKDYGVDNTGLLKALLAAELVVDSGRKVSWGFVVNQTICTLSPQAMQTALKYKS